MVRDTVSILNSHRFFKSLKLKRENEMLDGQYNTGTTTKKKKKIEIFEIVVEKNDGEGKSS